MLRTLQILPHGVALANLHEADSPSQISQETTLDRCIRSFYLTASSIVSRVDELEVRQRKIILVVDDERATVQLIDEFVKDAGVECEILTAISGIKALDIAVSVVPDLIITDWLIPEMDGLELIQRLKANPVTHQIPVVMATGVMAPSDEFAKVLRSGAIDYIRKPLDYREVMAHVKAALAGNESRREMARQKDVVQLKDQFVNFLTEATPFPVFYQDRWGRFVGCNRNFERLVRLKKEEFIGKVADEFLPQPDAGLLDNYFWMVKVCGAAHKFDAEMSWNDGQARRCVLTYTGLGKAASIELVVGSIADGTAAGLLDRNAMNRLDTVRRIEREQLMRSVEKLKTELEFKQRELSLHQELLLHSRNAKEKLIEGVNKLQPYITGEGKSRLNAILKHLHWALNEESSLNIEKKFDELNSRLYFQLEQSCPEVTKNEKRLCAYLKMNHTASDIARITNKSLNSVNVGFARLRAKLGLPNTKDLRSYLNELLL